jgi:hypothetical protein
MEIEGSGSASESGSIRQGMDPLVRIRIRIHAKMSWIRNTAHMIPVLPSVSSTHPTVTIPANPLLLVLTTILLQLCIFRALLRMAHA